MSDFRIQQASRGATIEMVKLLDRARSENRTININQLKIELLVNYALTINTLERIIEVVLQAKEDKFMLVGENIIPIEDSPPVLPELPST